MTRWLGGVIASGVAWWLLTLGGGAVIAALLAQVTSLRGGWRVLFAVGVFLVAAAAILGTIRLALGLLPRRARQALQTPRPHLPALSFFTPQQQLTDLIEEGKRLQAAIPAASSDPKQSLVLALTGATLDYPALVFEWEARVWRLLGFTNVRQWRGLYTHNKGRAQQLLGLKEYVAARVDELQTILGKL